MKRLFDGKFINAVSWLINYRAVLTEGLALVNEWQGISEGWDTLTGLKARVTVAVKLGKLIAGQTETTADDEAVAQIEQFALNDNLLTFVAGVLAQFKGQPDGVVIQALTSGPDAERISEEMAAQNLNWPVILEAIKAILALISMFTNKAPAPAVGEGSKPAGNPFDFIQS